MYTGNSLEATKAHFIIRPMGLVKEQLRQLLRQRFHRVAYRWDEVALVINGTSAIL